VTALDPFPNIANYPDREWIDEALNKYQRLVKVPADKLAKEAGTVRARNMVMVGAASRFLPIAEGTLEAAVTRAFAPKGERIMSTNLTAFRLGRDAALSTASVGE
jgi:indolepyruvate ferredoxin oxidoreductase beta subunit